MSNVMSHFTLCSKNKAVVYCGCIQKLLIRLCMKVSLVFYNIQNNMLLNQGLFPNFFQ